MNIENFLILIKIKNPTFFSHLIFILQTIEIYANESELGQNATYKKIFYIFISTFGTFVPLILLATFNCFLVAAVHRSHKMRHTMTNTRQVIFFHSFVCDIWIFIVNWVGYRFFFFAYFSFWNLIFLCWFLSNLN